MKLIGGSMPPKMNIFLKHTHTQDVMVKGRNGPRAKEGKLTREPRAPNIHSWSFLQGSKKKELTFLSLPSSSMQTLTNPETDTRKISMAAPHPDIPSHSQGLLGSLALKLNQLCKERECV